MTGDCVFCDHDMLREADLYFENDFCIYTSTRDPRDPLDVMPAAGAIVPKVHRASVFDLTAEEWSATRNFCFSYGPSCTSGSLPTSTRSAGTITGFTHTCMSFRASMTSRWSIVASDRESKIPLIGDLIRGVPAPEDT